MGLSKVGSFLPLLGLAVLGGCERAKAGSVYGRWASEEQQLGDTTVVRTVSGSVWGDTLTLEPDLAIGTLDGPDHFVFGQISGLDVDPSGALFAADAQARQVRVFSAGGEHTRTFGGQGDGPGEFRSPDLLRVAPDGRIVVRDQAGARFAVFSTEGAHLTGWPRASGFATNAPFFLDSRQRVVNPTFSDRLVAYELDGRAADTIQTPTLGYQAPRLNVTFEGGSASYSIPFMPSEQWTMTRDGRVIIGIGDRYAIDVREVDGSVTRIERITEPIPVAVEEAAQAREQVTRRIRSANNPAWRWEGIDVPSTKPVFQSIRAGIDGTIWILREGRSIEEDNPEWNPAEPEVGFRTIWRRPLVADVFDEEGRYLGPVKIPPSLNWSFPPVVLSREYLWGAVLHEAGYPQVVRFRVEPR